MKYTSFKTSKLVIIITLLLLSISCEKKDHIYNPTVTIISPKEDAIFNRGEQIEISVDVNDPDDLITSMTFRIDERGVHATKTKLYKYLWSTNDATTLGSHEIKIVVTDHLEFKESTSVTIEIVDAVP